MNAGLGNLEVITILIKGNAYLLAALLVGRGIMLPFVREPEVGPIVVVVLVVAAALTIAQVVNVLFGCYFVNVGAYNLHRASLNSMSVSPAVASCLMLMPAGTVIIPDPAVDTAFWVIAAGTMAWIVAQLSRSSVPSTGVSQPVSGPLGPMASVARWGTLMPISYGLMAIVSFLPWWVAGIPLEVLAWLYVPVFLLQAYAAFCAAKAFPEIAQAQAALFGEKQLNQSG